MDRDRRLCRGRAEYMLGKLPSDSQHVSAIRVIIDQIDRVARTIRQLLDFARVSRPASVPRLSRLLQQVLINLRMNACDACREGGRIVITAAAEVDAVRIDVSDDACGIQEEYRHQVFDPSFILVAALGGAIT